MQKVNGWKSCHMLFGRIELPLPRRSIGKTHFLMTYRVETVIPLETGFLTLRTSLFTLDSNDNLLEKSLGFN